MRSRDGVSGGQSSRKYVEKSLNARVASRIAIVQKRREQRDWSWKTSRACDQTRSALRVQFFLSPLSRIHLLTRLHRQSKKCPISTSSNPSQTRTNITGSTRRPAQSHKASTPLKSANRAAYENAVNQDSLI